MKTRKELKKEYKQMKFPMGVFRIKNIINGKEFIGSSPDLNAIWHSQKLQLDMGIHNNSRLQKEWTESGAGNFIYEILEVIEQTDDKVDYKKEIKILEEIWLDRIRPFGEQGYNKETVTN